MNIQNRLNKAKELKTSVEVSNQASRRNPDGKASRDVPGGKQKGEASSKRLYKRKNKENLATFAEKAVTHNEQYIRLTSLSDENVTRPTCL